MGFNRRKMEAQRAAAAEKERPRSGRRLALSFWLFVDDLIPPVFGKHLLSNKPAVSQIARH